MPFSRTKIRHPVGQWWWTIDRYLLMAVFLLIAAGMMLNMAASPTVAERVGYSPYHFTFRQALFVSLGVLVMITLSALRPEVIQKLAMAGLAGCFVLLLLVYLIGPEVKGAKRWLYVAGFSLQPSEFVKPFFAIVCAWILSKYHASQPNRGFLLAAGLFLLFALMIALQPDIGMTLALSAIWGTQMFLAGLPLLLIAVLGLLGIGAIMSAYMLLPHVKQRINSFLDPSVGDNYQIEKSLEAFINGGFLGKGPGEGVVKRYIPDAHTDFIFAVVGEEYGLFMSLVVVAIFIFIITRGFLSIYMEKNLFILLATAGLLTQFAMQTIVNMGVALSLLPNTGMTLPFVSYGGSSTLSIAIAMGCVLSFTRRQFGLVRVI